MGKKKIWKIKHQKKLALNTTDTQAKQKNLTHFFHQNKKKLKNGIK